jgi:tetratricopeptide (TPR) repeat protein
LRQRLLGALAVHLDLPKLGLDPRLLSKPPVFEAYQQWSTGIELIWQDPNQGLEHLRRAADLDPEFAPPWLTIADEHTNRGDCGEADRILRRLEQRRHRLTPYEHLLLKIRRARLDGRFAEAQRLSLQLEELVPNDLQANFWVVVFSIDANRPQDAIDAYARLTHGPWEKHFLNILRSWWVQYSYHRLGRHEEELRETEGVMSFDLDPWTQPTARVPALAALGRTDELERLLGVTATLPAAYWMDQGALLRIAAEELRAHGHREAALRLAERGVDWWRRQGVDDLRARRNLAATLYLAEKWEDAREVYGELTRLDPEDATALGRLGALAAREGDREKALAISARLAELFAKLEPAARSCARGEHALRRAGIAALLGQKDEAVRLTRESIAQGLQHAGIDGDWHIEPDLEPLHGYAAYEQLMEPEV